jgi:RNA polymerase sigma factor (sigma-70 family)
VSRPADDDWFSLFVTRDVPRLRQTLVARYGHEVGADALAEAIAWAWERRDELRVMGNPVGYLFRVAQSSTRPHFRWARRFTLVDADQPISPEPPDQDLLRALAALKHPQRVAVVLVHSHGWSYRDVAEVLEISTDAVRNHVHRGLRRLRDLLEEDQ